MSTRPALLRSESTGTPMPRLAALLAALLLALFLVGGANRGTAQEVSIKVLVNDDPISDYDIDQRMRFLAITEQSQPSPELKQKAIDMLIEERLQMQEGQAPRRRAGRRRGEQDPRRHGEEEQSRRRRPHHRARQDRRQHQDAQGPHQVAARLARVRCGPSSATTSRSAMPTSPRR